MLPWSIRSLSTLFFSLSLSLSLSHPLSLYPSRSCIYLSQLTKRRGTLPTPSLHPLRSGKRPKEAKHDNQPQTYFTYRNRPTASAHNTYERAQTSHVILTAALIPICAQPALPALMSTSGQLARYRAAHPLHVFLPQVFIHLQLTTGIAVAFFGHLPGKINTYDPAIRALLANLPHPDDPTCGRQYVLPWVAAYPCRTRDGKRHGATPHSSYATTSHTKREYTANKSAQRPT